MFRWGFFMTTLDDIAARLDRLERALLKRPAPPRSHYRIKDIVSMTGVSARTVRRWADAGLIPGRMPQRGRVVLFLAKAVDRWIERGMQ